MSEPVSGDSQVQARAARWRRVLAGLIDFAFQVALGWPWLRRALAQARSGEHEQLPSLGASWRRATRLLGPVCEVTFAQLGSPGQRLLGLRRVDPHTGARQQLWRTLMLAGARLASGVISRRLAAQAPAPEGPGGLNEQARRLRAEHADDPRALEAALRELHQRHRREHPQPSLGRVMLAPLAGGLLVDALRRRLAPTVLVRRS